MIPPILTKITTPQPSFTNYINSKVQISKELEELIMATCKVELLPKNQVLLQEGSIAHRLYFLTQGAARTYYLHDGKDITSWIYKEGQMITAWSSFIFRSPSYENIELLEDAEVASISYDQLQQLYIEQPKMQAFGRIMVEEQLAFLEYFYKGFMFMTAKDKYALLQSYFPDVVLRVNLGYIASFLGITQETLSRIRRKS